MPVQAHPRGRLNAENSARMRRARERQRRVQAVADPAGSRIRHLRSQQGGQSRSLGGDREFRREFLNREDVRALLSDQPHERARVRTAEGNVGRHDSQSALASRGRFVAAVGESPRRHQYDQDNRGGEGKDRRPPPAEQPEDHRGCDRGASHIRRKGNEGDQRIAAVQADHAQRCPYGQRQGDCPARQRHGTVERFPAARPGYRGSAYPPTGDLRRRSPVNGRLVGRDRSPVKGRLVRRDRSPLNGRGVRPGAGCRQCCAGSAELPRRPSSGSPTPAVPRE